MGENDTASDAPVDGRRARRERGRIAVVDAAFALAREGKIPVTADMVAERSGVSVASIFRYFDGLDDLQYRAYERFRERYAHLVEPVGGDDRRDRIRAFVQARIELYEEVGNLMVVARLRAIDYRPMREASTEMKAALAAQVRGSFAAELATASPGRTAELVAVVDAFTAPEAWDLLNRTHARSRTQIAATWRRGVTALVADWEREDT